MSQDEPSATETRPCPPSVRYSVYGQYAILILAVIGAIVTIVFVSVPMAGAVRHALAGANEVPKGQKNFASFAMMLILVVQVIISLLWPVALGILAPLNRKGRNGARITTWVFAGLGLLCGLCGLISMPLNMSTNTAGQRADRQSEALTKVLNHAADKIHVPGWVTAVSVVEAIVLFVLYLLVIIFLAVPASNDYFRKRPPKPEIFVPRDAPKPPPA